MPAQQAAGRVTPKRRGTSHDNNNNNIPPHNQGLHNTTWHNTGQV